MCTSSQVGDHWLWKKTQGAPRGLVSSDRFLTCITLSNMWARGRKEMSTSSCLGKITFCRWRAWETERKETLTGRQQESHKIIKRKIAPEEQKGKDCQERREQQTQGSVKATASWISVSRRSEEHGDVHTGQWRGLSLAEGRLYPHSSCWEWRLILMENPIFIHCFLPGGAKTLICALNYAQTAGSWCKPAGTLRIPMLTCRSLLDNSRALQEQHFLTLHTAHSRITVFVTSQT